MRWALACVCGVLLALGGGVRAEEDEEGEATVAELRWASGSPDEYEGRKVELRYDGGSPVPQTIPFGPDTELLIGQGRGSGNYGLVIDRDFDGDLGDERPVEFQIDMPSLSSLGSGELKLRMHATERVDPPWAGEAGLENGVRIHLVVPDAGEELEVLLTLMLHRSGTAVLAGRARQVEIRDGDGDLRFDGPADRVRVDLDGDLAISEDGHCVEHVVPGKAFSVLGRGYVCRVEGAWARRVRFTNAADAPPGLAWRAEEAPPAGVICEGDARPLEEIEADYKEVTCGVKRGGRTPVEVHHLVAEAGRLGTPGAFAFLERVYRSRDSNTVRESVLNAMGDVRFQPHAAKVVRITGRLRDDGLCLAAARSLHRMDAPDRAKVLVAMAKRTKTLRVFREAVLYAAYTATPEAIEALERLVGACSRNPARAWHVYRSVTGYSQHGPSAALIRRAVRSKSTAMRAQGLLDAQFLPHPEGRDLAIAAVRRKRESAEAHAAAAEVLGRAGDAPSVAALLGIVPTLEAKTRRRSAALLQAVRDPEATALLLEALEAGAPAVRRVAAEAAACLVAPTIGERLADRIGKESEADVRAALVRAAGRQEATAAVGPILDLMRKGTESEAVTKVAIRVMLRLGFGNEDGARFLLEQATSAEWMSRLRIVDAAALSDEPLALPVLHVALGDERWTIRLVATHGLARRRQKESVPPLIDRLDVEDRARLRQATARALYRITGMSLYDVAERWRRWWTEKGETFEVPDEVAALPEVDPGRVYGTFYGIPVESDRVIFVIDQSGSMDSERVTTGRGGTEFERAVEETLKVVSKMPNGAKVNVILFESDLHAWKEDLVVLNETSRTELARFLRGQEPLGATDLYGGLARAIRTEEVDTIYLLSDGTPTAGRYVQDDDILRAIEDLNWFVRAIIHTVSLDVESGLLEELADRSGGIYVQR